jgi:hypothetical protein
MSTLFWGKTSFAEKQAQFATQAFYGLLILCVGPFALVVGWWLQRVLRWQHYVVLTPLGVFWMWWWWQWVADQSLSPVERIEWWWGGLVVASPLVTLIQKGWILVSNFLRPRDIQDQLEEQKAALRRKEAELSRTAATAVTQATPRIPEILTLGTYITSDLLPKTVGVRRHQNWVQIEERLLNEHMLIVGTTGAGKSETLKRLVVETLQASDRDIFFVDGKGDLKLGQEMAQLIFDKYQVPVPLFSLGTSHPGCIYNGFRGDRMDIYNRLAALVGVEDASGNARYFADISRDILQLVCYAPGGPPRCFEELQERLTIAWLNRAYTEHPLELDTIATLSDDKKLDGLLVRLRPLIRDFAPLVGEEGFILEESHGAIFSLRTLSVGDSARRFLGFLMEDLKDFAGKRQRRPGLLIIDEFGAFQNEQIVALLALARSAQLGVVLATQDVASLGEEEQQRQLIMANTRTKLLMATDFPEAVAQLAGTKLQIEAGLQLDEGQATGMGSARVQHAFRVDMNEVSQLEAGEAFLIRQRYAVKLKMKQVGAIPLTEEAVLKSTKQPYTRTITVYTAPHPTASQIRDLDPP